MTGQLRRSAIARILIISLVLLQQASYPGEGSQSYKRYDRPREVPLKKVVGSKFKEYYGKEAWNYLLIERFYPIGWSNDGKFAYLVEPVDQACGCYSAKLVIQDLRTDKVLWIYEQGESVSISTLHALWKARWRLFSRKMREHGIQAGERFPLLIPPIHFNGRCHHPTAQDYEGQRSRDLEEDIRDSSISDLQAKRAEVSVPETYDEASGWPYDARVVGYKEFP